MNIREIKIALKEDLILYESQYKQFLKMREADYNKALAILEMSGANIIPIKTISFKIECEAL